MAYRYDRIQRSLRLNRIARLRRGAAPAWVIRTEQVALAAMRRGLRPPVLGRDHSVYVGNLMARYVAPLMGAEEI